MKVYLKVLTLVLLVLSSANLFANPQVISREYKLMLNPDLFNYDTELNDAGLLFQDIKTAVELAITRDVLGSPVLSKERDVMFYDTASTCELHNRAYSFRERIENGLSEVTLKFRSADRYISDFEDLSSSTSGAVTKLESDIGSNSSNNFKVVYGHSTKADNTRNINEMKDVNVPFPGFDADYTLSNSLVLTLVGDLTIFEHVYKNMTIDLGQFDAVISITLWYQGVPSGAQAPVVAEVSFKYEDSGVAYTRKVVNRAKKSLAAIKSLTQWVNPDSLTKTAFVYNFNPTFCQ